MNRIFQFLLSAIFCATVATSASAQTSYASKKEINEYQAAVKMMNEGQYKEALSILQNLVRTNKQFMDASWTLSELYGKMGNEAKMLSTLEAAAKPKNPRYHNTLMRLAKAYHETCHYEKAIQTYSLVPKSEGTYYRMAQAAIKQCQDGIDIAKEPMPYKFVNMGPNINTDYDDYWPATTADESLFSTTIKIGKLEGQSEFGRATHEDIYYAKRVGTDKLGRPIYDKIKSVGPAMNSVGNEGAQSFSLDGRYMFFIACSREDGRGGCDIYYSIREGDKWSKAINCGAPLNTSYWETYPTLSPTGDVLYFASNRPGGIGKSDIWKCDVKIKDDGRLEFSNPVNLGKPINTPEDELSPFIHADNHTLFYSSKGMKGLGKYDIFMSQKDSAGKWSQPVNLGAPLNTCKDEIGFILNAEGNRAYYSSNGSPDGKPHHSGRDIYEIYLDSTNIRPTKSMVVQTGKIIDKETGKPVQAKIDIFSIKTNEKIFTAISDKSTGEYVACVPKGEEVGENVNKRSYMLVSEQSNKPTKQTKTDINLEKIEVGKKITLKNIYFDFDKATLKKVSYHELDHLIEFMKINPTVKIRLCGHTDSKGNAAYNKTLSENRAKAAFEYLVSKGIKADRLEHKGYGAEQPIADNKTDAGRALNRRTEFVITGK